MGKAAKQKIAFWVYLCFLIGSLIAGFVLLVIGLVMHDWNKELWGVILTTNSATGMLLLRSIAVERRTI